MTLRKRAVRCAAVMAAVSVLAACSDSGALPEIPAAGGQAAVTFGTAPASRATGVADNSDVGSFAVSGYYCTDAVINTDAMATDDLGSITSATLTASAIMDNVTVTRQDDGSYTYLNKVYWPQSEQTGIQFFALYPADITVTSATGDGGSPTGVRTEFTVSPDVAGQQDLLYAVTPPVNKYVEWDKQNRVTAAPSPVDLSFSHTLSRISFKVVKDTEKETDADVKFFIRKITLYAIDKGTLTLSGTGYGSSFTPTAVWSVVRTYPQDDAGNTFSYTGFELNFAKETADAADITDADGTTMNYDLCVYDSLYYPVADNGHTVYLNDGNQYMLMIPQQKPSIGTGVIQRPTQVNLPMVHIDYVYDNGKEGDGRVLVDGYATISIGDKFGSYTGADTDPYLWEAGQSVVYTIKLSTSGSVLLVSPTHWDDGTTDYGDGTTSGDVVFE